MISQSTIDYVFIPFLVHLASYWSTCAVFYLKDRLFEKGYNWPAYRLAATTSIKNQFYISLPTLYITSGRIQKIIESSSDDAILVCVAKLFIIVNISNLFFYWSHRLLHVPFMFRYVHYKHHEFIEPVGVAALYAHPLEHFISNTLSFILPFLYVGCNYYIMLLMLGSASVITVLYHTKYFFIFNDHLIHHQLFKCNYGFGGYLDKMFGTYRY